MFQKQEKVHENLSEISKLCAAYGVKHVVICPGSRSAPLVFAFTQNPAFTCYSVIDERSAAYMALGMAQQTLLPTVLICTSGTAALNFYPAIAEALYQQIPLLVLTADRPPELLNQQDGQMINQDHVFEKNCKQSYVFSEDLSLKQAYQLGEEALLATTFPVPGPVHINIPLREPLYEHAFGLSPKTTKAIKLPQHPDWKISDKKTLQIKNPKIIILVGQLPVNNNLYTVLRNWKERTNAVILCDVLSNKQSLCTAPMYDLILSQSNDPIKKDLQPDILISFGGPLVSKNLKLWLKSIRPALHFRIQPDGLKVNTYGNVTDYISTLPARFLEQFTLPTGSNPTFRMLWEYANIQAELKLNPFIRQAPFNELGAMSAIFKSMPDAINVQLANSSVVRYANTLGQLNTSWTIHGNRGTSGIDGCSSTAVGAAIANNKLTVLITGDLAFLYDKNAFWNGYMPNNLRVIIINNEGGGIFTRIEGPGKYPDKLSWFTTPQKNKIKQVAEAFDLKYHFCNNYKSLEKILPFFFQPSTGAAVLEIKIDMKDNARILNQLKKIKLTYAK